MTRRRWIDGLALLLALLAPGCTTAPKGFVSRDLYDPAPLKRARAVTLNDRVPNSVAVPVLVGRLDDPDPVVRLTANQELERRTGRDFGYHAWDDLGERAQAIGRWRTWWAGQTTGPVLARQQQP